MPIIATFFGILIRINFREHNPPHFHAEYQGYKAIFEIGTGKLLAGNFPAAARRLVKEWTLQNKKELIKNWNLAQKKKPTERITGGGF